MIVLPLILFAGYIANVESIVFWMRWFQYLSPVRYTLEIFYRAEYRRENFMDGDELNKYPVEGHNFDVGYAWCFIIMTLISIGARTLAFFFLKLQTINPYPLPHYHVT
jgi:ABC-type multidrug transport system permease subunit